MFFDEEMLLDLRLNIMNKYVDKFIITEATYTHSGSPKKLVFDIKKFSKFKDKIIYIVVDKPPSDLFEIFESDKDEEDTRGQKLVLNALKRENHQRQMALSVLKDIDPEDWIIINDIDEIPNLKEINLKKFDNDLIFFKQKIFYYKFNLLYEYVPWYGSKACKKRKFISPQWLRNIKDKKYPAWRLDTFFSKKKYNNIHFVENGGWHFTSIKSPEDIEKKLANWLHHYEFEESGIKLDEIKKIMNEKKAIYDYKADQRKDKFNGLAELKVLDLQSMPDYIIENTSKYKNWIAD
jgi:beta-1,4-mannosyl-glycoprotein beta-1,4-N-acetylglucosaminyltransferase